MRERESEGKRERESVRVSVSEEFLLLSLISLKFVHFGSSCWRPLCPYVHASDETDWEQQRQADWGNEILEVVKDLFKSACWSAYSNRLLMCQCWGFGK